MPIQRILRSGLAAVAGGLLCIGALHGQEPAPDELRGRVVDAEGRPVVGTVVAVHRVSEAGGAEVARTTSDGDGRFVLPLDTGDDGIYFAATRYEGAIYAGPPFRELRAAPPDYVIVVGGEPAAAAGPAAAQPGPPPEENPWPVVILLGLFGTGAVLLPLAARRRPYAVRSLLVELAELEERYADADAPPPDYAAEREALRARIRELTPSAG